MTTSPRTALALVGGLVGDVLGTGVGARPRSRFGSSAFHTGPTPARQHYAASGTNKEGLRK